MATSRARAGGSDEPMSNERCTAWYFDDLKTRREHSARIAHQMYGKWMEQVARSLTDPLDGILRGTRYLVHIAAQRSCAASR